MNVGYRCPRLRGLLESQNGVQQEPTIAGPLTLALGAAMLGAALPASAETPPPIRGAQLCEHIDYQGRCWMARNDVDLTHNLIGNDTISSIRVGVGCL